MVTLDDIKKARERIGPYIEHTPLIRAEGLDELTGCRTYIKAECFQKTGSFKIRGALNKVLSLSPAELQAGVVTASSGNHGKGVAFAARLMGAKAVIVMPETAPRVKVEGIKALGAEVCLCRIEERHILATRLSREEGYTMVHAYDDNDVIAGQGTAGLEIMEDMPYIGLIVVPIGGGGLVGGISTAVKSLRPETRIVGAEPAALPRYSMSLSAGYPLMVEQRHSVADALLTIKPGERNFPIIRDLVDEVLQVEDEFIIRGMEDLLLKGRILAEPSSCIGIGAALQGLLSVKKEEKICFLISGGNVGRPQLEQLLCGGLA